MRTTIDVPLSKKQINLILDSVVAHRMRVLKSNPESKYFTGLELDYLIKKIERYLMKYKKYRITS